MIVKNIPHFDPFLSADCGQAFRWCVISDGMLEGVVQNRVVQIKRLGENEYDFKVDNDFFNSFLFDYFDLGRDYSKIISGFSADEHLSRAVDSCPGIRILKQDEWEAVCSFIISANNNIPRIKGIIERLCASFGEPIDENHFTFPRPEKLASLNPDDLSPVRAGFRAKYIIDAAQKVSSGEVDFQKVRSGSLEEGEDELEKIKGVGKKVAQCALLYGFGKVDAFPEDVWVKRIMTELYPAGLPDCTAGCRGIAQQYLFWWYRNN